MVHLGGHWERCSVTCQEDVTSAVSKVLGMIGSIVDVIPQLLGQIVTVIRSANSCLHLGGQWGVWSVTC